MGSQHIEDGGAERQVLARESFLGGAVKLEVVGTGESLRQALEGEEGDGFVVSPVGGETGELSERTKAFRAWSRQPGARTRRRGLLKAAVEELHTRTEDSE